MTAKEFWEEFKGYEEGLRHELEFVKEDKKMETFSYLCSQLESYCHGLTPNISAPEKDISKNYILSVSCSGNRDLLLYVNRLIDLVPEIEHWDIKALVDGKIETDPKMLLEPFTFEGFSITPKDIRFTVYSWDPEKDIFDLLLLLPLNLAEIDDTELENAFMAIFEELWGERFVGEKINCLFFTHNATSEHEFFELEMLEVCLNSFE
ncbi:hypothetical protein [Aequorivita capsosiphonis]|uniref:hypothetical protein n=1 Tax=Aequorivita capsosiphonis TaxID=487317 RepID=UPI0004153A7C|nr:hypothetical protein [Aequorivita capsosiphonis]